MEELYQKFLRNECTKAELKVLLDEFSITENEDRLREIIGNELKLSESSISYSLPGLQEKEDQIHALILRHLHTRKIRKLRPFVMAAASVIIALSVGAYFLFHKPGMFSANTPKQDVPPGSNGAILTLATGRKIVLEEASVGPITQQGGADLQKAGDSALVYLPVRQSDLTSITYNTLTTPKGHQYSVILPDGTKVWLNAASSITYPTTFAGKERKVSVTGEAYFEVKHNEAQPFVITTSGQTIEDIGTEFNINAYTDEPVIRTTLVKGSVRVTTGSGSYVLEPRQAAVSEADHSLKIKDVDVEAEVSWRNGYFKFDNEDLESVMRKISRWYNVDIEYMNDQKISESYFGSITRFDDLLKVLQMLEKTGGVRFKINGRTIIVMKK